MNNKSAFIMAVTKLKEIELNFDVSQNGHCQLGENTSLICQNYEPKLNELEFAVLLEKRRKILAKIFLADK